MAEWLLLRLARGTDERVSWMSADARGQPLAAPQLGTLRQAASAAEGRRLAVIVPSSEVLITEVELPVKAGVRLAQVVPYALEEQLAADIETLHFAVGSRDEASGRTTVAIVTRALMDQWLGSLRAVGLTAEVLCTEASLMPDNPSQVIAMLEGDTLWVRRAGEGVLALPAVNVGAALAAALGERMAQDNLIFYVSPEDWQHRSAEVEALRRRCASLKVQLMNFGPLPLLAPPLSGGQYLNLLSGDYAPQRSLGDGWRQWRLAATLAIALLALHLSGLALQLHQQHRTEQALDAAIGQIASRALPGDSGEGAVRARVEQRLLAAQGGGGLIPALAAVADAVQASGPSTHLETLSFEGNNLDLKLLAGNAEQLDQVDQSLRSNGWQAQLTSGSASGSAYEGRIQAHGPGGSSNRAAP